ncbi:MAG TPA: hypothetical protein VJ302_21415 [Blastocatellia bacterium]|nr:hypothetical protein [Blastocatellia bacterium]
MNIAKRLLVVGALLLSGAWSVSAQTDGEAGRVDDQTGLRIHRPNANWAFHEPDAPLVRALLKPANDPVFIRVCSLDNFKKLPPDEYFRKIQQPANAATLYSRVDLTPQDFIAPGQEIDYGFNYDPVRTSRPINGRQWHTLTGKIKKKPFSLQFYFEGPTIFLLYYEAATPQLFQQYQVDRDARLARLEFGAIPVRSFNYFEAFELEIVPDGQARLKAKEITRVGAEIRKELGRKQGSFKEIRPSRTQITEKTLLLTIHALNFKKDDSIIASEVRLEADLVFTDKETGRIIYTRRITYRSSHLGPASGYWLVGSYLKELIKLKKKSSPSAEGGPEKNPSR